MANIMINEVCNLKCPYCFADEFVNKKTKEMSLGDFDIALKFALSAGNQEKIGIIGGEPTLHSRFREIVRKLIVNDSVKHVLLFTNGTNLLPFLDELCHPKIRILINCNSPHNMGQIAYEKMLENLNVIIEQRYKKGGITLGINMYHPDFEYDYLLEILKQYSLRSLRTSISVPNEKYYLENPISYFASMKSRVLTFFSELASMGVIPFFDCNAMPLCVWTAKERQDILQQYPFLDKKTNILSNSVQCSPVIDILPDLTIIRCFGLSKTTKQALSTFRDISDAKGYYYRTVDALACNITHSNLCQSCEEFRVAKCFGGCLCFKNKR